MKVGENCIPKPGSEQFSLSQDEVTILIENVDSPRIKNHMQETSRGSEVVAWQVEVSRFNQTLIMSLYLHFPLVFFSFPSPCI